MRYYLIAFAAFLVPALLHWNEIGFEDFDQIATLTQIAVWWWEKGDFNDLWNPFLAGGYPLAANGQLPLYHPVTFLSFLWGPAIGLKVLVLLAVTGGFFLARLWFAGFGFAKERASLFAAIWVLNGFFIGHLGVMHAFFVSFLAVPGLFHLIHLWVREGRTRYLAAFAALTALAALGAYAFLAYFVLFLPLYFLAELVVAKPAWRRALFLSTGFFVVLALTIGLLGIYLVPAMSYLRDYPRALPAKFENPLWLVTFLFFPGRLFDVNYPAWEYQYFIGPVLFFFLVASFRRWRAIPHAFLPALAVSIAAIALSIGSFRALGSAVPSPFDLFRDFVPGYGNLRVTSRFLLAAMPGLLLLALWRWSERGITRLGIFFALTPLVAFQLHNALTLSYRGSYGASKKPPYAEGVTFLQQIGEGGMYRKLSPDTGLLNAYETTPLPGSRGKFPAGPLSDELGVVREGWSRLRIDVRDGSLQLRKIPLNMNFHPGWKARAEDGPAPEVSSAADGRLLVTLVPETRRFELIFEDPSVAYGRRMTRLSAIALFFVLAALTAARSLASRTRKTTAVSRFAVDSA